MWRVKEEVGGCGEEVCECMWIGKEFRLISLGVGFRLVDFGVVMVD